MKQKHIVSLKPRKMESLTFRSLVFQRVLDDSTVLGWGYGYTKDCSIFCTEENINQDDEDGYYKVKSAAMDRAINYLTNQGYDKDNDVNYLFG